MKRIIIVLLLFVPMVSWAQTADRELFSEAETRFRNHDYEIALDRYAALISEYPLSEYVPDAQFRRAVAMYRLQRYQDAQRLFDRVETRYRSTRYLRFVPFWKGVVDYYLGQYTDSIRELDRYRSATGSGTEDAAELASQAMLYTGLSQIALGKSVPATQTLEALVGPLSNPADEAYGMSLLMSLYRDNQQYQKIIDLFERADLTAVADDSRYRILLYAAEAYYSTGAIDRAVPLYTKLQSSGADTAAVAFQRLFQIAQKRGDGDAQDRVLRAAEVALAGRTDVLAQFWLTVGIESFNAGKMDLAELYFRRIWDLRSSRQINGSAPLYLAEILVRRNDASAAAALLEQYLQLVQGWKSGAVSVATYEDRVLLRLGGLYLQAQQWDAAAADLNTLRSRFPASDLYAQASYQYSYALYRSGDLGSALSIVDDLFSRGRAAGYSAELLRLRASILRQQGQRANAIQSLKEYLVQRPNDTDSRVEYVKLLFQDRRYATAIAAANALLADNPKMAADRPSDYVQVKYVLGVSYVSLKDYRNALAQLSEFQTASGVPAIIRQTPGLSVLYPYELFYLGWSYYRTGDYRQAIRTYGTLLQAYPDSPLAARSAYLAGWSAYSVGDYAAAEQLLGRVKAMTNDSSLAIQAQFLLGQSYVQDKQLDRATVEFQNIFVSAPDSGLADDARFEYASALAGLGQIDDAASAYDALYRQYPTSQLAEQGLFDRADLYYHASRFADAREAYFQYRTNFPSGRLVDAALYWGGMASSRLNEPSGALLLWERLIAQHRDSAYRSDAMQRSAEIYQQRGDYRSALNLYTEMIARYPDEAKAAGIQRKADELVLLIGGLSEQEASLWVTINSDGKAGSNKGRQAILQLGRLIISGGGGQSVNQAMVVPLLQDVASHVSDDAAAASQAKFLLGEVYAKQPDYLKAAETYLDAATTNPADQDLTALGLYRAAEMYKLAGRPQQTSDLVAKLEKDFPKSEWTAEAKKLLEN